MNRRDDVNNVGEPSDLSTKAPLSRRAALRLAVMSAIGTSIGVIAPGRAQSEPSLGLYVGDELTQSVVLSSATIDALGKKGGIDRLTIKITKDGATGSMKPDPAFKENLSKALKVSR